MENLENGQYYYLDYDEGWLHKQIDTVDVDSDITGHHLHNKNTSFYLDSSWGDYSQLGKNTRLATPEEIHWLDKCIEANEFIDKITALEDFNNKVELNYEIY